MNCAITAVTWNEPSDSSAGRHPYPRLVPGYKPGSMTWSPSRTIARGWPMHDPDRPCDVTEWTAGELERTRGDLRTSLALARPDSVARGPILAQLSAIETELAER